MKSYVYIFVRQDLPLAQQIVQSNHASIMMSAEAVWASMPPPSIVLIGVPDRVALLDAGRWLEENMIDSRWWFEPDFDYGITAIATVPIDDPDERECLAHFKLWTAEHLADKWRRDGVL